MNKRSQFQLTRRDGKVVMTDAAGNEYKLTAAQANRLGNNLSGEAKQLRRAHGLRRLKLAETPG